MKIYKTLEEVEKDIENCVLAIVSVDANVVVTARDITASDITTSEYHLNCN